MKALQEFREKKNLTTLEMANLLSVSESYYYKIEKGWRNPSFNFITKFKGEFDVNVDLIFFKSERDELSRELGGEEKC